MNTAPIYSVTQVNQYIKGLLDRGIHAPTIYFPLIVKECLMAEPTETESKDSLEHIAAVMKELYSKAVSEPEAFRGFPVTAPVSRPDELKAAKDLKLTFDM